jgi:4-amino-4-deoxy-L-arabinose transferase-like glycosyltransferase
MVNITHIKDILRPYRIVILILVLIAFILRIPLLQIRYYDPDEFQHLHGARQIYHGEIPYRDYFDHHTPFLHFIMSGLYPFVGDNIQILDVARSLMLVFTAFILCLTFILTKKLYSTDAGLLAVLFLSYVLMFLEKTLEIRPDLGAVIFWLASMIFMVKGVQEKPSLRFFMLSGLSMGIALMFTQKSMFGLPGIFLALIYPFIDRRIGIGWKQNAKLVLAFLLGISIPLVLTCLFFLAHGALWQFINCNFIMNSQWKMRFSPMGYIRQLINQNPFFLVMGLAGLLANIVWMYKKEEVSKGIYIPIFCTLSVMAGLFILPVPYRQYYQLFLPLLAIYSGFILDKVIKCDIQKIISDIKAHKQRIFPLIFAVFILMLIIAGLVFTLRMSKPSMNNLNNALKFLHLKPAMLYLILWIPFVISAIITFIFKKREYAAMLIAIGIIAHPLDQMINQLSQRNDGQIANIQYILDNTSPSEAVLDGWSGYGFLRPQAYYYYFLHGEMRAMLTEKELTDDLIKSVEEHNTKIIIYDGDMRALPQKTRDYITNNYVPTKMGDLYIRKTDNERVIK